MLIKSFTMTNVCFCFKSIIVNNVPFMFKPVTVGLRGNCKVHISLTESNGMGHIWSRFGNGMGKAMAHICL